MAYSSYSLFNPIRSLTSSISIGGVNQSPTNSPSLYFPRFAIYTCMSIRFHILFVKNRHKKTVNHFDLLFLFTKVTTFLNTDEVNNNLFFYLIRQSIVN